MNPNRRSASRWTLAGLLSLAVLGGASAAVAGLPQIDTPAPVDELVQAIPFSVDHAFPYGACAERPLVAEGWVVVLRVNLDLAVSRQVGEPVLYGGPIPAWRSNTGEYDGYVVAMVPGNVDLSKTPIWYGQPELPERITSAMGQQQLALARAAGIEPFDGQAIARAVSAGGDGWALSDFVELTFRMRSLVERFAPGEASLANR